MRKIHQAIADARQELAFSDRRMVKINKDVTIQKEGDEIHLYYYGLCASYNYINRSFTVYIRGYEGKSFSQTELGYIRAFVFEGMRELIKINSQPFTQDRLKLVQIV